MKKIAFQGMRSNRMPFAYPEYKKLFREKFEYVENPVKADFLVYSCLMDIQDDADELERIFLLRPDLRLVILSEEPLWDTLWSGEFLSKGMKVRIGERDVSCVFLNHFNARIYDFEQIPYFLTTSDDFFARYSFLFKRNRDYKEDGLKTLWSSAPLQMAFYAEYRDEEQYDAHFPERDIKGLCRFRTLVARDIRRDRVVRIGRGWGTERRRQVLPDWHLDKLASLDRRSFLVSGMENTHQWNYISEKVYDSFAVLAVPLYYSSPLHGIWRTVPEGPFINLHGLTVEQAVEKICSFRPDKDFIDRYRAAQERLADTFSKPMNLVQERRRVVAEVVSEFEEL